MKTIVIIGHGQLGHELSARHLQANDRVVSISRSQTNPSISNHQHLSVDLDSIRNELSLPRMIDCLYYLAPPSSTDLTDRRMAQFLEFHTSFSISHIIYVSTSGVYADSKGQWITEDTSPRPKADRAKRRLNAEQQLNLFHQQTNTPVTILRCAAIYSTKTINQKRIRENTRPVILASQAPYTNRIHLQDLTEVCWQAMQNPAETIEIYNVSDGCPSTTTEHAWLLADLAGVKRNDEVDISEADKFYSPAYMSYLHESKKIDITKLKQKLKPRFKFENCIDGIKNCLKHS